MNSIDNIFARAVEQWRVNKGIGTLLIPFRFDDRIIVLEILQKIYKKNDKTRSLIVTNDNIYKYELLEYLENDDTIKNIIKEDSIRIINKDDVYDIPFHYADLIILYRPVAISDKLLQIIDKCRFKLIVLNKLLDKIEDMKNIYKISPMINSFTQTEVEQALKSFPVEETLINVDIPIDSDIYKEYIKDTEYINESIAIFGSFDILQQANTGNKKLNISASQICNKIAYENGWNQHLDMSIPININLDCIYNPNILSERASNTFNVIRHRNNLISDYKGKLDKILDIIKDNRDKKILIINKRADFASDVTKYINDYFENEVCMSYHDKLQSIEAFDVDGNPLYYKSGEKRGERKMMGAKAQKTLAVKYFNLNKINILSTNKTPDVDLAIDVDVVIITSTMCLDISSYLYRLSNLVFRQNKIELFTLYCNNTSEEKILNNRALESNHIVKNLNDDVNNPSFIIDD